MEQPVRRSSYIFYGEGFQKPARGSQLKTLYMAKLVVMKEGTVLAIPTVFTGIVFLVY